MYEEHERTRRIVEDVGGKANEESTRLIMKAKNLFQASSMRATAMAQPAERMLELRERYPEHQGVNTGTSKNYASNHTSTDQLVWQRFEESWRDGQLRDEPAGDETWGTYSTPHTHHREIRNGSAGETRDEDCKTQVGAAHPRVEAPDHSPIGRDASPQRTPSQVSGEFHQDGRSRSPRPYVCDLPGCTISFKRPSDMRRHQQCHFPLHLHPCEHCSLRFALPGDLQRHTRAVHGRETGKARTDTKLVNESAHEERKEEDDLESRTTSTLEKDTSIDHPYQKAPTVPQPIYEVGDKVEIHGTFNISRIIGAKRFSKQWWYQLQSPDGNLKKDIRWFPESAFPWRHTTLRTMSISSKDTIGPAHGQARNIVY